MKKAVKISLGAAAGLFAGTAAAGYGLVRFACGRRPKRDYWDANVLAEEAPYKKDETIAVRDRLAGQKKEEIIIQSFDGLKLWGMLLPVEKPVGTVVLMHGWHGDWKTNWTCFIPFLQEKGYNVLVNNERAHGKSEGKWITYGVKERKDVASWVEWVANRYGKDHPIFLGGISMGSATVQMCADMDFAGNVCGIYADCGYTSPAAIMECVLKSKELKVGSKKLHLPVKPVMKLADVSCRTFAGFDPESVSTLDTLSRAKYPVLFVHGEADDFVPCYMTKEGYLACASEKQLVLVPDALHTRCWFSGRERVSAALGAFLDKYNPLVK